MQFNVVLYVTEPKLKCLRRLHFRRVPTDRVFCVCAGMSEVGIYRVAGVLRDVRELRDAFDTDYLKAQVIAFEADIHAVAGLLKKYFRELPDALFTSDLYLSFVQGMSK